MSVADGWGIVIAATSTKWITNYNRKHLLRSRWVMRERKNGNNFYRLFRCRITAWHFATFHSAAAATTTATTAASHRVDAPIINDADQMVLIFPIYFSITSANAVSSRARFLCAVFGSDNTMNSTSSSLPGRVSTEGDSDASLSMECGAQDDLFGCFGDACHCHLKFGWNEYTSSRTPFTQCNGISISLVILKSSISR